MKPKFSVPYNQDPSIIKEYIRRKKYVRDVYLPANPAFFATGRDSFHTHSGIPARTSRMPFGLNSGYDREIQDIIDILRTEDIGVTMLMNGSCDGGRYIDTRELNNLISYLSSFRDLSAVTFTNAYYAKKVREALPTLKTKASVIAGIDTVRKAMHYEAYAKVDVIAVASDVNKCLPVLKNISRAVNTEIQIIVNSGCMHGCPFFSQHYNYLSHLYDNNSDTSVLKTRFCYEALCKSIVDKAPWTLYTCQYIAPKNLHHYQRIVDEFKLVDRALPTKIILEHLDAYIEGRSNKVLPHDPEWCFDEPDGVFERVSKCDRNCAICGWCEATWKKMSQQTLSTA